ncbi:MAG: transglutaminase domain-containing protein, partial [Bacteroidales bacterium]|nr:transglutaminase domain-containing protein [Bacteroidales bacterium]
MKKCICSCVMVFIVAILLSCNNGFDGNNVFKADFEKRSELFAETEYFSVFAEELTNEQREALQFLYAYMPTPDITDYSGDFHLMNVDYALKARAEMPWGKQVPDREFLHFVLPIRVNNENLDECRAVFYEELKDRVRNLSMYDAVLEVNHWCHEKVTYTPSDGRTSSPLATIRTAHGRCGEESTFTVAALRAVGIPARQIYTPRWAHTD